MFKIQMKDGTTEDRPNAKRFKHYVANVEFWFAYDVVDRDQSNIGVYHYKSGLRLLDFYISPAFKGDIKAQAKYELDRLIQDKGEARVASALRRNE